MGKALLIIVIAAALGGSVMMLQMQGTERQTESQLAEAETEFLAREAARSGYEVGVGEVSLAYAPRPGRVGVQTANVPQGVYDLSVEETPEATLVVTATGRATYGTIGGTIKQQEHTLWGEFSRIVEAPSAVVIDGEEVTPTFTGENFRVSGNDMRPAGTARGGVDPSSGLGTPSYAFFATQPGVAEALREGLGDDAGSRVEGRGADSATGSIAQGGEYPALLQSIYEEAMGQVGNGGADVVRYEGDRVFAGTETFGSSPSHPKVVYVDGDVVVRGKVQGHGVLIVHGDLTIEGLSPDAENNFAWEGLVFVRQEGEATFSQAGPTRIDGGLVVQAPPREQDDEPIDFEIDDEGEITVNERFAAQVEVLGAAISAGGAYDVPVTIAIGIDGDSYTPWGNHTQAVTGNINDNRNPRSFNLPDIYEAGERIVIEARSFLRRGGRSGRYNSDWYELLRVQSGGNNNRLVKVLRNGDRVPQISGFMNQTAIAGYVDDYVVGGRVHLADNQAIYLFELGETNVRSDAADFQDAVVLVTLSKEVEVAGGGGTSGGSGAAGGGGTVEEGGPTSRVNFTLSGKAEIQYSSEAIGRLAAQLQSARAVASVQSLKQRSFDPTLTHEVMPTAPGASDEEDEGDDSDKITICHRQGGAVATLEISMAAFQNGHQEGHNDTIGACSPDETGNAGNNGNGGTNNGDDDDGDDDDGDDDDGDDDDGDDDDGDAGNNGGQDTGSNGGDDDDNGGSTCNSWFDWFLGRC